METIAVPFEADAVDRVKKAAAEAGLPLHEFIASAAERVADEQEALSAVSIPEEEASMARAMADIEAGRLVPHDEVFAKLDAKHGW